MTMQRWRGFVTMGLLTGLVVVVALGAVWRQYIYLPPPAQSDPDALMRWLVLRELDEEPMELRRVLAVRLEEEFADADLDWAELIAMLTPDQRDRVWRNSVALAVPWLEAKMDQYFDLPPKERCEHVRRLADLLTTLREGGVEMQGATSPDASEGDGSIDSLFQTEIDRWREETVSTEERNRIDQFYGAIQAEFLMRALFPAPRPDSGA